MSRFTVKGKRFENLIFRADNALAHNYCIEASTIYYAIMEERFISVFGKLGVTLNKKQKIAYCIEQLIELRKTNQIVANTFSLDLLKNIDQWRSQRNGIIHDFAKQEISYEQISEWAKIGQKLMKQLNASVMRFKKQLYKIRNFY